MKTVKHTTTPTVVTIGNFDGLHKGHQKLIKKTVQIANKNHLKSLVCSFNCNTKGAQTIYSPNELKKSLISFQVDLFVNLNFLKEIKHLDCEQFANQFLKEKFHAKYVIVGEDFKFGANQSGDVGRLKELGKQCGFCVISVSMHKTQGEILSSTVIRKWLNHGDIAKANRFMLQPFSIAGKVQQGYSAGTSLLNVPTANIAIPKHSVSLPFGVYITTVEIDGKTYPSVSNVGFAPTLPKKHPVAETFILSFSGDIYGKSIKINFYKYIRKERKFSSLDALKKQIEKDIATRKTYFDKKGF